MCAKELTSFNVKVSPLAPAACRTFSSGNFGRTYDTPNGIFLDMLYKAGQINIKNLLPTGYKFKALQTLIPGKFHCIRGKQIQLFHRISAMLTFPFFTRLQYSIEK